MYYLEYRYYLNLFVPYAPSQLNLIFAKNYMLTGRRPLPVLVISENSIAPMRILK